MPHSSCTPVARFLAAAAFGFRVCVRGVDATVLGCGWMRLSDSLFVCFVSILESALVSPALAPLPCWRDAMEQLLVAPIVGIYSYLAARPLDLAGIPSALGLLTTSAPAEALCSGGLEIRLKWRIGDFSIAFIINFDLSAAKRESGVKWPPHPEWQRGISQRYKHKGGGTAQLPELGVKCFSWERHLSCFDIL